MIDFLRGLLAHRETEYAVLDVHGVGYQVFCANPFGLRANDNDEVTLFIHHHVREDAVQLFGFPTREEQALFRRLLDVSGIGPKVALGILSGGSPEAVIAAIQREDVTFLTRLPGIGKKTAQRMILDLKDKLAAIPVPTAGAAALVAAGVAAPVAQLDGSAWAEAKQALMALGYSEAETDRVGAVVRASAPEDAGVDALLKLALQAFYKG